MIKSHKETVKIMAKDKHKINLLRYLGDPENDFPTARQDYAKLLNITLSTLYGHFTPEDFLNIEQEAYDLRKKNSSKQRAVLLKALYNEGRNNGSVPAIKEFLDRTEGKVTDNLAVSGKVDLNITVDIIDSSKRITD